MGFVHDPERDFDTLLGLAIEMVDSLAGRPIEKGMEWKNDRQTLAKKLIFHLSTIQSIRAGAMMRLGDKVAPFVDYGSINVLARAVVENFIVFAHVFDHLDDESSRHRHMVWHYCGLKDRQRRVAITEGGRRTLESERPQMEILLREIKAHPLFKAQSNGRQKKIEKGDWSGGRQWGELAIEVGLNPRYFMNVYSYLCDYSHSSYAAALQVRQAKTVEDQVSMARGILGLLNLCMARFVVIHARLFDESSYVLKKSAAKEVAERWNFDASQFEKIYVDRAQGNADNRHPQGGRGG